MVKGLRHQIDNEINSLMCLQGIENVVQLQAIYKNSSEVQLVTEYAGDYNLEEFIHLIKIKSKQDNKPYQSMVSETQLRSISHQLLSALDKCHSLNIIHRDLKPQNIIFKMEKYSQSGGINQDEPNTSYKQLNVTLADFGVSTQLDRESLKEPKTKQYYLKKLVGTPGYIDPNVLTIRKYHKEQEAMDELCKDIAADDVFKLDLFGLGSTLHYLITGQHLFHKGFSDETDPF